MIRSAVIPAVLCLSLAVNTNTAAAATPIPAGQRVKDIRVIGQSVRVDGTVQDRAIVIDGDLTVGPHGKVTDPILIGGRLRVEGGGTVRGDVLHLGTSWPAISPLAMWSLVTLLIALRLAVVWAVVSAASLIARRPLGQDLMASATGQPTRTVLAGALTAFGLLTGCLLLTLTLIGLPVGLALGGLLLAGTASGVSLLLVATDDEAPARRITLVALAVPFFGDALAALATVLGLGAGLRYLADSRPRITSTSRGPAQA